MNLTGKQLADLARLVADTADHEIDCDEMLARAAGFLDAIAAGACAPSRAMAEAAQHLRVCPECREEFEALVAAFE